MKDFKQFLCIISLCIYQCNFFATIQAFEIPKHMQKGAKKLTDICMKETGASEDLFREAKSTGLLPTDQRMKCFLYCVLDKIGLIDSEHIIHLEHLFDVLPEEIVPTIEKLHTACGTQSGADGCETAYLTIECYIKTNPVIKKLMFANLSD